MAENTSASVPTEEIAAQKTVSFFIQYFEKQLDFFSTQIEHLRQKQQRERSAKSSQAQQQQSSRVDRVDYRAPEHKARLQTAIDEVTALIKEDSSAIHRLVTDTAKKYGLPYNTLRDNYLRSKGTTKKQTTTWDNLPSSLTPSPFLSHHHDKGIERRDRKRKLPSGSNAAGGAFSPAPMYVTSKPSAFQMFAKDANALPDNKGKSRKAIGKDWASLSEEERQRYDQQSAIEKEKYDSGLGPKIANVYKILLGATGYLGGNGAGGAIYGEITQGSMQDVLNYMKQHCQLSHASRFLDIGSGLGKPNFHAYVDPCVSLSVGVELEEERYQLSLVNLRDILKAHVAPTLPTTTTSSMSSGGVIAVHDHAQIPAHNGEEENHVGGEQRHEPLGEETEEDNEEEADVHQMFAPGAAAAVSSSSSSSSNSSSSSSSGGIFNTFTTATASSSHHHPQPSEDRCGVMFAHLDVDRANTLNPFTHIYSFDVGFPPELLEHIADKFKRSQYAEWLVSYQPPNYIINDYHFPVVCMHKMLVNCQGSGESHTVYFYRRNIPLSRATLKEKDSVVEIPARRVYRKEKKQVVRCDPLFLDAVRWALTTVPEQSHKINEDVAAYLAQKSKRARKSDGVTML